MRKKNLPKIILFLGIFLIYGLIQLSYFFFEWRLEDYSEYRSYKSWPVVHIEAWQLPTLEKRRLYFSDLQKAASDQFPLRNLFFLGIRTFKFYIFGMPAGFYKVTKDGIFWNHLSFKNLFQNARSTENQLLPFKNYLKKRISEYKKKNISFNFFVALNKEHLLVENGELNPDHLVPSKTFFQHLAPELPDVIYDYYSFIQKMPLENALVQLYYKTDIHWTVEGARLFVSDFLFKKFGETISENVLTHRETHFFGSTTRVLGIFKEDVLISKESKLPFILKEVDSNNYVGLRQPREFEPIYEYHFPESSSADTALVIGDSMVTFMIHSLGLHFRKIIFVKISQEIETANKFKRDWLGFAEEIKASQVIVCVMEGALPPMAREPYDPEYLF